MINILCPPQMLKLGRKGENEFRTIEFDVAPWLADYPNGSISVVYMRPDGVVYPPEVSTANGVTSWVITSVDTAAAGAGYAEIRLIDGDVVGKSARINTMVYLGINGTEVAPPAPDWTVVAAQIMAMIGNLDDLTTEAKSNLVAAINEAAESGGGGGTSDHRQLTNRDASDQHPMSAITGLVAALAAKGTYSKPTNGIPYADLASDVQASLDKADSALQSVPDTYRTAAEQDGIDAGKLSTSGGTMTGDIDMGFNRLRFDNSIAWLQIDDDENAIAVTDDGGYTKLRVGNPDDDNDAVNKGYADEHYAEKNDLQDYRTSAAQDAIDSGFVKLVGTAGQTIQTNVAVPLNVKNNIALQHRSYIGFQTHDDATIGYIGVDGGKPTFLASDGVTAKALQSESITDSAGYFTTDTVEGALAEIGAELAGVNTLLGSGVIT